MSINIVYLNCWRTKWSWPRRLHFYKCFFFFDNDDTRLVVSKLCLNPLQLAHLVRHNILLILMKQKVKRAYHEKPSKLRRRKKAGPSPLRYIARFAWASASELNSWKMIDVVNWKTDIINRMKNKMMTSMIGDFLLAKKMKKDFIYQKDTSILCQKIPWCINKY